MDPLEFLRQLGSVDQLQAAARKGAAPSPRPAFNTHIHLPPNFSAFESVQEAVDQAAAQGVKILGAGNYYDFTVYQDFASAVQQKGIFPLFNTEIISLDKDLRQKGIRVNDPGNPGKIYICGKGISKIADQTPRAKELLSTIRHNDTLRMRQMIEKMTVCFKQRGLDMNLDDATVIDRVVRRHGCKPEMITLQERHAAQAFQEVFFEKVPADQRTEKLTAVFGAAPKSKPDDAVGIQNEIRSHLMKAGKPCFVPETFITPPQAHELILQLGGIPCYPALADGAWPICEYETPIGKLVDTLKDNQYTMVEFIPLRNSRETLTQYAKAIRAAGILLTVGTEHNTLDMPPLEPACLKGVPIPQELMDLFWEGTCVLAAHQYLSAHGRCGYVEQQGRPNPDYADAAERIEAFKKLGAAVLQTYFQNHKR